MTTCDKLLKNVAEGRKNEEVSENFLKIILLSIITFGIYLIITVYRRNMFVKKYVERKKEFFMLYNEYLIEKNGYKEGLDIQSRVKKFYENNNIVLYRFFILSYIFFILTIFIILYIFAVNGLTFKDYNIELPFIPDFFYKYHLISPYNLAVDLVIMFFFISVFYIVIYISKTVNLWNNIQKDEKNIFDTLGQEALNSGLISHAESYNLTDKFKADKGDILFYTIITAGIWLLFLDYKVYSGVESMVKMSHSVENSLVSGISVEENI